jgi:hypothetical protein
MSDDLRSAGLLPFMEPYTGLGYTHVNGGGGEMADADMMNTTGPSAPIDWVFVELRDAGNWGVVVATRAGMVLSDGSIVEPDDNSPMVFNVSSGNYFIGVKHRNHLSVCSGLPVSLSNGMATVDFTSTSTSIYGGANALTQTGAIWSMVSGDLNADGDVRYVGSGNDRDDILVQVGGSIPTDTYVGYHVTDSNMDGVVKYAGSNNDRDIILLNVGGSDPTLIRQEFYP